MKRSLIILGGVIVFCTLAILFQLERVRMANTEDLVVRASLLEALADFERDKSDRSGKRYWLRDVENWAENHSSHPLHSRVASALIELNYSDPSDSAIHHEMGEQTLHAIYHAAGGK